jgi:hypothetical protein
MIYVKKFKEHGLDMMERKVIVDVMINTTGLNILVMNNGHVL